jgi:alkyl sulfatase BDS1-like metallo-beta-lactamase superfamily hydrolase
MMKSQFRVRLVNVRTKKQWYGYLLVCNLWVKKVSIRILFVVTQWPKMGTNVKYMGQKDKVLSHYGLVKMSV